MKKLSALLCSAFIVLWGPICQKELTPEERLMMDLREILRDAYGEDYEMKVFGMKPGDN